jgi:hypothetical protein
MSTGITIRSEYLNRQSVHSDPSNSASTQSTSHSSGRSSVTNPGGTRNTPILTLEDSITDERRKSPVVLVAEATVILQAAALLEDNNFREIKITIINSFTVSYKEST